MEKSSVDKVIRCRKDLHASFIRNQFIFPTSHKDSFVTVKFMLGVLEGIYWLPKLSDLQVPVTCATPPTKKILTEAIMTQIEAVVTNKNNEDTVTPELKRQMMKTSEYLSDHMPSTAAAL